MTTQAGAGDAGNNWHRQLFVGQIPIHWTKEDLEKHLVEHLKIQDINVNNEILFDREIQTPPNRSKKHTFIRFKSECYHTKALKKETFADSDVKLNIKESNHENEFRKLFFGRLNTDITKEKITEMIGTILPGYEDYIEDDFPQVPEQKQDKSRIAFVLFKTHQAAKDVKDAFKKLIDNGNGTGKDLEVIELLRKLSHEKTNGNDGIQHIISSVDYHKRKGKDGDRAPSGDAQYDTQYNGRKSMTAYESLNRKFEVLSNESGDMVLRYTGPGPQGMIPLQVTVSLHPADWERGKFKFGAQNRSAVEVQRSSVEFQQYSRPQYHRSHSQPINAYNPIPTPHFTYPRNNIRRNHSNTNTQRTTQHQTTTPTQTRSESVLSQR